MYGMAPLAYRARFPPAERHVRIPRCVALAYGRPQNRTFREDRPPHLPSVDPANDQEESR